MSHPYSGAASYIYANEYRTPTALNFDDIASPISYHYHQQPQVEFDFRIGTGKRPDASELSLGNGVRVGYGRTWGGNKPGIMASPSYNLSPSSQASSLPSQTTTRSSTRTQPRPAGVPINSWNNSDQVHVYPHIHSYNHIPTHPQPQSHSKSYPYDNLLPTEFSSPQSHFQPSSLPHLSSYSNPHPDLHPHSRSHHNLYHTEKPLPDPLSNPKPKIKIKTKFKLTLPNPFSFSFRFSSSSPKKSPVWPPPHSPPVQQSHLKRSKSNAGRNAAFPISSRTRQHDDDDDDPNTSNWRWSLTIDQTVSKKKRKKGSLSRLGRWLSIRTKPKPSPNSTTVTLTNSVSGGREGRQEERVHLPQNPKEAVPLPNSEGNPKRKVEVAGDSTLQKGIKTR